MTRQTNLMRLHDGRIIIPSFRTLYRQTERLLAFFMETEGGPLVGHLLWTEDSNRSICDGIPSIWD